jgi:hypothetical protein
VFFVRFNQSLHNFKCWGVFCKPHFS